MFVKRVVSTEVVPQTCLAKKAVLDFFGKFRGNHQYRSFFFHKVAVEHLQMVASVLIMILYFGQFKVTLRSQYKNRF